MKSNNTFFLCGCLKWYGVVSEKHITNLLAILFKLFIYLLLSFKDNSVESNYHSVFMNGRTLLILHFASSNKINTQDQ